MKGSVFMLKISQLILNLLFPSTCLGCQKDGLIICQSCQEKIKIIPLSDSIEGINHCFIACHYDDKPVTDLIKNFKYKNLQGLANSLAQLMINRLQMEELPKEIVVIPVPLHKNRLKRRGYNQSQELAQHLAEYFNWELNLNLVRIRSTLPQASLNKIKRLKNIENAFSYQGTNLSGRTVLLVDDVTTTGQTLKWSAQPLKKAGATSILAIVIAKNI